MNNQVKNENNMYWEIIIPDDSNLSGVAIHGILEDVQSFCYDRIKFVLVDDIIGANTMGLGPVFPIIMEYTEALRKCKQVVQFDWGDFYCFEHCPNAGHDFTYTNLIPQSIALIRAVDSSDIYMYTNLEYMYKKIASKYPVREINYGDLKDFVFPF